MAFPHILEAAAAQVLHLNEQLDRFERLPPARQRQIQAQSLAELFAWGMAHSPFWRDRLATAGYSPGADPWALLGRLPVLSRSELQNNFDLLSCAHAFPAGACTLAHSTGSTGRPVRVLTHAPTHRLRYLAHALRASLWHRLDFSRTLIKYSVRVSDGLCPNWGAPEAWFAKTGPLVLCPSVGRSVSALYEPLATHRPAYVVSAATVAHTLARHALVQEPAARPRIEAFLSTGETLLDELRQDCLAAFGARVINRYTTEEVGWVAVQCPRHEHLHVMGGNVIVEIVDEAGLACPVGQPGRVLVTALHSTAMPLIRYDIGDMAEWGEACDCGLQLPVVRRIWGRQGQFFRTPGGELRYIAIVAEDYLRIAPICDMRFRHYPNPLLRLEVVSETPLSLAQQAALKAQALRMLDCECPVDIVQCQTIAWGETDKRIAFMTMESPWEAAPRP